MTVPDLVLAFVLALLYASIFHFMRGGNGWRFLFDIGLSVLGFAIGQMLGAWRGWSLFMLGSLNLGLCTAGSWFFLIGGDWLSRIEVSRADRV